MGFQNSRSFSESPYDYWDPFGPPIYGDLRIHGWYGFEVGNYRRGT